MHNKMFLFIIFECANIITLVTLSIDDFFAVLMLFSGGYLVSYFITDEAHAEIDRPRRPSICLQRADQLRIPR